MDEVVISLLEPLAIEKTERWVEEEVDRLRELARPRGIRLGPLERSTPAQGGDWLIPVDRLVEDIPLEKDVVLAGIVIEMAWLGLRPHLLVISQEPVHPSPLPPLGPTYVARDLG
jgi:hypothetical protein